MNTTKRKKNLDKEETALLKNKFNNMYIIAFQIEMIINHLVTEVLKTTSDRSSKDK